MQLHFYNKQIEDFCEELNEYEIPEYFAENVDNFTFACIMIRQHILHRGDFNRTFLGVVLDLEKLRPVVPREEYERAVNQALQFEGFYWVMLEIMTSVRKYDYNDVSIDMSDNGVRLVVNLL